MAITLSHTYLSIGMGILAAVGMEAVGFNATHHAIENRLEDKPNGLAIGFVATYLLVGGGALWFTDVEITHKVLTSAMFAIVAVNYGLIGIAEIQRMEQRAKERDDARQAELESIERQRQQNREDEERQRKQRIEDEARQRQWQIEDDERAFMQDERAKQAERKHEINRAKAHKTTRATGHPTGVTHGLSSKRAEQLKILQDALNNADSLHVENVQDTLGLQPRAAANVIKDLREAGVILSNGKSGHYQWAQMGN